jgi:hypothetical protein
VSVAAVASLAGVEVLAGGDAGGGLPLAVSAAEAAQLQRLAAVASAQQAPGTGQWEYTVTRSQYYLNSPIGGSSVRWSYANTVQEWQGPAPVDALRERITADGVRFATPADQAVYAANRSAFDTKYLGPSGYPAGDPTGAGVVSDVLMPHAAYLLGPASVWDTSSPPADPQTLLADLASRKGLPLVGGTDRQVWIWDGLSNVLESATDPQLRATAYRALAYAPDTTVLGDQAGQLGQRGVAVRFTGYAGYTVTIIVSPTTGYLLEDIVALTAASRGMPAGSIVEINLYLQHAAVGSGTALPGGGSQPLPSRPAATTTTTPAVNGTTTVATATTSVTGGAGTTTATTPAALTTATTTTTTATASTAAASPNTTTTATAPPQITTAG